MYGFKNLTKLEGFSDKKAAASVFQQMLLVLGVMKEDFKHRSEIHSCKAVLNMQKC